jgi:hypothetical protein
LGTRVSRWTVVFHHAIIDCELPGSGLGQAAIFWINLAQFLRDPLLIR